MSNLKLPALTYTALAERVPANNSNLLAGKSVPVGYKTRAYSFGECICIQHHDTTIATLSADGSVHITNAGYGSSTTRARLHSILQDNSIAYDLTQKDFVQVLRPRGYGETYQYFVSAYFSADGKLLAVNGNEV